MKGNEEKECSHKYMDYQIDKVLLDKRRIFLSDSVDQESAKNIIRKLWYLEDKDPKKPILLVINSPGGAIDSGFAIWDQIKMSTCPVYTLISGLAASFGSLLGLVADKGKRFATPYSRIMIHQPLIAGVIQGQATDLEIQAKEMLKTREIIIDVYVKATGKDAKTIAKAIDRDNWMTATEAKDFGLIDHIVDSYESIFK